MKNLENLLITRERDFISERLSYELLSKLETTFNVTYLPLLKFNFLNYSDSEVFSENDLFIKPWILITSANSYHALSSLTRELFNLAVIGEGTSSFINKRGIKADFVSNGKNADEFALSFVKNILNEKKEHSLILFQGSSADNSLRLTLEKFTNNIKHFISYEVLERDLSEDEKNGLLLFLQNVLIENDSSLTNGSKSKVCVLSSLQAKCLIQHFNNILSINPELPKLSELLSQLKVYSIGEKTSNTLIDLGFKNIQTSISQNLSDLLIEIF